jgi:acyl-coenzyme A thioesterase PaaI-like protein
MKAFDLLPLLIVRARRSSGWLALLNFVMGRLIPFNRPHRFRIVELQEEQVVTCATYRRANHNHIRGIHACAIATVAEFSAGLLLLSRLHPGQYRLIMSKLDVEYLYQAKKDITARTALSAGDLQELILTPLETAESVLVVMATEVSDSDGVVVARARTSWQIKRWDKVRTKVQP